MNNLASDEEITLINVYLANCNNLENAIPTASSNLDTQQAAVWYHNQREVADRYDLYKLWCRRLAEFMGVKAPGAMINSMAVVI